jgi:hypothetical protein
LSEQEVKVYLPCINKGENTRKEYSINENIELVLLDDKSYTINLNTEGVSICNKLDEEALISIMEADNIVKNIDTNIASFVKRGIIEFNCESY